MQCKKSMAMAIVAVPLAPPLTQIIKEQTHWNSIQNTAKCVTDLHSIRLYLTGITHERTTYYQRAVLSRPRDLRHRGDWPKWGNGYLQANAHSFYAEQWATPYNDGGNKNVLFCLWCHWEAWQKTLCIIPNSQSRRRRDAYNRRCELGIRFPVQILRNQTWVKI